MGLKFFSITFISIFFSGTVMANSFKSSLDGCLADNSNAQVAPSGPDYLYGQDRPSGTLTPAVVKGATTVSPEVASCMIEKLKKDLIIIDTTNIQKGIPGALPFTDLYYRGENDYKDHDDELTVFITKKNMDIPLLVYCANETCMNSWHLAYKFHAIGHKNILWLRDGLKGWHSKGYPIEDISFNTFRSTNGKFAARLSKDTSGCIASNVSSRFHLNIKASSFAQDLRNLSCISADDSEELELAKVSMFWSKIGGLSKRAIYNSLKGHIAEGNADFVKDFAKWKLNLNDTDPALALNRNLLDFVRFRVANTSNPTIKSRLNEYYSLLKSAGAVHSDKF